MTHLAKLESWAHDVSRRAPPLAVAAVGLALLIGLHAARDAARARALSAERDAARLQAMLEEASAESSERLAIRELKAAELAQFKDGLSSLTQSRRALYEGGLALQEDKRLLEKQWEIMSTYLMLDEEARKVHVMRGEQSLESYAVEFAPAKAFGEEKRPLPSLSPIVSKERFAHPERGRSDQVEGQLQWEPPQVGTSQRANALGEFVMFTRGPLILHGPPTKPEEHEAFAHVCLGLSRPVAAKLYQKTFIGTRLIVKPPVKATAEGAKPK